MVPPNDQKPLKKLICFTKMAAPGGKTNGKQMVALGRKNVKKTASFFIRFHLQKKNVPVRRTRIASQTRPFEPICLVCLPPPKPAPRTRTSAWTTHSRRCRTTSPKTSDRNASAFPSSTAPMFEGGKRRAPLCAAASPRCCGTRAFWSRVRFRVGATVTLIPYPPSEASPPPGRATNARGA